MQIRSTFGYIWSTFALLGVYWVIFGSAMTYILFESNLLIIWSTLGYFVSTLGYVGSALEYMWSTLSYVGYVGCTLGMLGILWHALHLRVLW